MGMAAGAAGVLFGLSIGALGAFFVTGDQRFDRVAEWAFVAFAVVAIATMLAVPQAIPDGGLALAVLTALGVAGAGAVGVGELASALRMVDFRRISPLVTAGFLAFLVWVGGVSLLLIAGDSLPAALGWLGLTAIVVGIGLVALIIRRPGVISGQVDPDRGLMTAFLVPMAAIVVWLVWLGQSL